MKRVVQYSIDILIKNDEEDSIDLEELIAEAIEEKGLHVVGVDFRDDMTTAYKDYMLE